MTLIYSNIKQEEKKKKNITLTKGPYNKCLYLLVWVIHYPLFSSSLSNANLGFEIFTEGDFLGNQV